MLFPSLEYTVYVYDLFALVLSQEFEVIHKGIRNKDLDDSIPDNSSSSNNNAINMLFSGERYNLESLASILNDKKLTDEDTNNNDDEEIVIKEVSEYIQLILLQLSTVQEVEDLEIYKYIKEKR